MKKFTVSSYQKAKEKKEKITMLTAYDYTTAKIVDEAGIDTILVGDSLGMTMLGYENTLQVTVDDMIHHTKAVARGAKHAMILGDMPFLSYHISVEETIRNAGRFIQEGSAHAVKLEGGAEVVDKIKGLVAAKIPVMGHLGLTPQSVNMMGGFKVQGKNGQAAQKIIEDALLLQEAGVFAIVLECIPDKLATIISEKLDIPTIGIGAGNGCDGQVLVIQDMIGTYSEMTPKFVKQYAQVGGVMTEAIEAYITEVKSGQFPSEEHVFAIKDEELEKLY